MLTKFHDSFKKLAAYCEAEQFKGYDPYDGLNSRFFQSLPLIPRSRIARLAWIQFFKRSPLNLRKIVGIKKEYNPKALGLFLASYCNLYKHDKNPAHLKQIAFFIEKIDACRTKGYSGACWGYNFDWESRAFFQPKFMPTIVASSFISNALLDAYEITGDEKLLATARSTCDFILKDLNRTHSSSGNYAFSYSPLDNSVVFNASLLGARLLARVYSITKETSLISESKKAVAFCVDYQKEDGSWSYGTLPFHQWIDNFHTGYNLECISDYMKFSRDISYSECLSKGFKYYIETFFTPEGIPKYYSNSTYPIDIHAPAQLIITLHKLNKLEAHKELMDKVLNWTIDNMQSEQGFFRYQINKYVTSKIPYMRWSQAWMFVSLSIYLNHFTPKSETII
ncbi:MAG: hypothetical protein ABI402_02775 [Ferruginibacter sp.]